MSLALPKMTLAAKLVAVSMTAVAGTAATLWTISSQETASERAERPPAESAEPPEEDPTVVCVGPDRVVRSPSPEGKCPADHEELELEDEDSGICELCDPFKEQPPAPSASRELDALERRLWSLENTPYFEVVDRRQSPIFRVGPGGVRVFNKEGLPVAAIGTTETGGFFTVRSTTVPTDVSIGATGDTAGFRIVETGLLRTDLTWKGDRSSLRFPSAIGLIAGMGESNAGTGTLLVGSRLGKVKVKFSIPDARGILGVTKLDDDVGGIALAEAKVGGGMLDVGDRKGNSAVKMGHNGHRYGIVIAGPKPGFPLIPKSGLPGSYFMGCPTDQRPACVPEIP
jgi:hypothetical protein